MNEKDRKIILLVYDRLAKLGAEIREKEKAEKCANTSRPVTENHTPSSDKVPVYES